MIALFFKSRSLAQDFSQREIKYCTAVNRAFRPDAPSMTLHDALHVSQSDSQTFFPFAR
jgi:hypothetical protein